MRGCQSQITFLHKIELENHIWIPNKSLLFKSTLDQPALGIKNMNLLQRERVYS